jgi:diguanylate cyclase (GGDEF)-like protein
LAVALDEFKKVDSVKSCYFCGYRENDRVMSGYFIDKGTNVIGDIPFPNGQLLPDGFRDKDKGMVIFFSLSYKNEVYGYAALVVDTSYNTFVNFKIEYLLTQVGQNINKLELYEKLFGISDVMSLYIRDPLTGSLNRRGFEQKISELFDEDGNAKKELAVVSIDMDGLKYINDNFGHNAGDEAIKETANYIENALNSDEFVARMGGDEFVAILILSEVGRVGKFIRNVRNSIREINLSGKYEFEISSSIGTCELTKWHDVAACMNKADKAMYLEKKAKKKNRD